MGGGHDVNNAGLRGTCTEKFNKETQLALTALKYSRRDQRRGGKEP